MRGARTGWRGHTNKTFTPDSLFFGLYFGEVGHCVLPVLVVDVVALVLSLHGSLVVLAFLEALVVADCQNNT